MTGSDGEFVLQNRWRLGHCLFEILLAAIIDVLTRAAIELATSDYNALCQSLETLTSQLEAATSAMHFTADFDPAVYRDHVRPTMEPPKMPPGFSGTLNERHAEFLERFRGVDAALKTTFGDKLEHAPPDLAKAWRGVVTMRSKNLAAHGLICEKFVPGGQSLLKEYVRSKKEKA